MAAWVAGPEYWLLPHVQVPESLALEPHGLREMMCATLTATFVESGAVHGSDGKGQESDEFELHDVCEDWDGVRRNVTSGFYSPGVPQKLCTERRSHLRWVSGAGSSSASANGIHGQPCRSRVSRSIRSAAGG